MWQWFTTDSYLINFMFLFIYAYRNIYNIYFSVSIWLADELSRRERHFKRVCGEIDWPEYELRTYRVC